MLDGWLEKAELKPTQPSLAGACLSLAILNKINIHQYWALLYDFIHVWLIIWITFAEFWKMLLNSNCNILKLVFDVCHLLSITPYQLLVIWYLLSEACHFLQNLIPFAPVVRLALVTVLEGRTFTPCIVISYMSIYECQFLSRKALSKNLLVKKILGQWNFW